MKIWKEARRAAIALGLICTFVFAVFAPLVPEILGIADQGIAHMATGGVRILSVSMPFIALLYLLTSYNVLTKRIAYGVIITGLYELALPVLFAVVFGNTVGIYGVFAGVAIAPAVTWFAVKLYVEWKEGKASWPLQLHDDNKQSFLFDFVIEPENIIDTQAEIEEVLNSIGIPSAVVSRCAFLFEEVYMVVYDKNQPKTVNGECIIFLTDDAIRFLEMDDGIVFEMVDEVADSHSLREYVLSQAIDNWSESSEYLKAISFNRNRFEISLKEERGRVLGGLS